MSICFCRFLLALATVVVALVWWPTTWAKIAIIVAAGLLAITSLSYNSCCCRMRQEKAAEATRRPALPTPE